MSNCYYNRSMKFFYDLNQNDSQDDDSQTTYYVGLAIGSICILLIFLCNATIIFVILFNKQFHFPFYYLLANLAAADVFASLAYTFLLLHTGKLGRMLTVQVYFVRQALLDVSLSASIYNLLVIAIERYYSVIKMQLHSTLSKRRVFCLILGIWAVAVIMTAIPNMGWNCICNISTCSVLAPIYSRGFLIFWSLLNILTLCVITAIYSRIYTYVRKKTSKISSHTTGSMKRRKMPMRLVKTIVTVLGTFIICWTPGLVLVLLDGLHCTSCNLEGLKKWFLLLALLNSLINPIIYSYKDREIWKSIKSLFSHGCVQTVSMQLEDLNTGSHRQSTVSEISGPAFKTCEHQVTTQETGGTLNRSLTRFPKLSLS
ncbi:lysophosphatidic acid receptor 3-like [Pristis pectinata]|uniref:lysophosphatidic acid receptor 3-like n=1 Tax=Pristis pectinata TaxID=685728 RepID=UPI00223DF871|nr:lysophosphatidic acid receptor 3-like [Pristis pectinata]XP_051868975.1 lysophosphatidic acid receptor 3-like [Pristis pectinata]XP_051868976.1 lysophosphatidic acid receptor 3-like [Pristis pectinata]